MKWFVSSCLLVLLSYSANAACNLEGWWRFVSTDGDIAYDFSLNQRHAVVDNNRVSYLVSGPGGGGLYFNGETNTTSESDNCAYAHVPTAGDFSISNVFTVAAWVFPLGMEPFSPIIFRTSDIEKWEDGFGVYIGKDSAVGAYTGKFADETVVLGGHLTTNRWQHIAFVCNGKTCELYLDGNRVASKTSLRLAPVEVFAPLGIGTLSGCLSNQPFNGAIADVRIWTRALNVDDVRDVYQTFLGEAVEPDADDDGDRISNRWEIINGLNPRDFSDAGQDPDCDGLSNLREYKLKRDPLTAERPAGKPLIFSITATTN